MNIGFRAEYSNKWQWWMDADAIAACLGVPPTEATLAWPPALSAFIK